VVVLEDVWGGAFEELSLTHSVERAGDAWADPVRLTDLVGRARVIVVRNRSQIDRRLLESAPGLLLVARAGVGLDNIDTEAADELGVVVISPRLANATSVAEHALGVTLALLRRLIPLDASTRRGSWERVAGRELAGRVWGILGAGATGLATARLAVAIGLTVLAHDPQVDPAEVHLDGLSFHPLEEVVARADVLSIHVPETPETVGLVDAALLDRMKPGALLVNLGRGSLIDEPALVEALATGRLGGAALDVRAVEPPVIGRLEQLDNVVLTPHVAGITEESQKRVSDALVDDILRIVEGRGPATHSVGRSVPSPNRLRA
jgi:D-3-phosphoglycerate dehydrogenase / 2-oxoglutarate reductase